MSLFTFHLGNGTGTGRSKNEYLTESLSFQRFCEHCTNVALIARKDPFMILRILISVHVGRGNAGMVAAKLGRFDLRT